MIIDKFCLRDEVTNFALKYYDMKAIFKWTALALLAVLVIGCCACRKAGKRVDVPLVGTEWQLVQLDGRTVQAENDEFTIKLDDQHRISGKGACNRVMGSYETGDRDALTLHGVAMTRMMCLKNGDLEAAFAKALGETTHYEVDSTMLLLFTNGNSRMIFQPKE